MIGFVKWVTSVTPVTSSRNKKAAPHLYLRNGIAFHNKYFLST